jgi:hypothetical protein
MIRRHLETWNEMPVGKKPTPRGYLPHRIDLRVVIDSAEEVVPLYLNKRETTMMYTYSGPKDARKAQRRFTLFWPKHTEF